MSRGANIFNRKRASDRAKRRRLRWPSVAAASAILFLTLGLPNHPDGLALGALAILPLELPIIVGLLLLSARLDRAGMALRAATVAFLAVTTVLKVVDYGFFTALDRPFNLAFDMPLLHAGWRLLSGSSGVPVAAACVAAALISLLIMILLIWWATGVVVSASICGRQSAAAIAAGLTGFAGLAAASGLASGMTASLAYGHAGAALKAARAIAALEAEAAADPVTRLPADAFLARLDRRDVILAFVESYGRSTHDNPLYAATTRAALETVESDLRRRGLAMRSAWLTSPVNGGQSWLAHATLLSGLWIDSQGRYDALLASKRRTLISLAAAAGRRTVAVMPAITMPWPESAWFDYTKVYTAGDLGYHGQPFGWVTMPDQYTLSAFERLELARVERAPIFAEIALISSHTPWTPIPTLVPWEEVGDGTIFNVQAASGDSPETVWRDQARIRDQFRMAVDYSLRAIGSFAARHAGNPPLLIVLGDHQPPVFVSGSEAVRDVPIHIIGDPATVARLAGWGWTDGLLPSADAPVWRMDRFRDRFLDVFSTGTTAQGAFAWTGMGP